MTQPDVAIAEVLAQHLPRDTRQACACGEHVENAAVWAMHVAAAAVEALQLTEVLARLDAAEAMVYRNIGPSPVLVEIRKARELLVGPWVREEQP